MPRYQNRENLAQYPSVPQSPEIQQLTRHVLAISRDRIQAALRGDPAASRSRLGRVARQVAASRGLGMDAGGTTMTATRTRTLDAVRLERVTAVQKARPIVRYRPNVDVLRAELADVVRAKGWTVDPDALKATPTDPDLFEGLKFKKLRMFITEVRCREETDEVGDDHILIGGTRTNYLGETTTVQQHTISEAMSAGDKRRFGMSLQFAGWNLGTDPTFLPCVYTAVVVMGERDDGGFSDLLREIWNLVDSHVKAAIGGLIGGAVGSAVPGLGTVIGALVGMLVGYLADWLLSLFGDNEDDLIDVEVLTMTLGDVRKSYYDWAGLTSAQGWTRTLFMRGDGGRYEVDVAFRVFPD